MEVATAAHSQHEVREWEDRATVVRVFETTVLPGLVQTPDYIRLLHVRLGIQKDVDDFVEERQLRQDPFLRYTDKKKLEVIVLEEACRWPAEVPEILKAQLRHLAELAAFPNIDFSIIAAGGSRVPDLHGYMLCEGPLSLVHAETIQGCVTWRHNSDVAVFREHWERSRKAALDPDATIDLLDGLYTQLDRKAAPPA